MCGEEFVKYVYIKKSGSIKYSLIFLYDDNFHKNPTTLDFLLYYQCRSLDIVYTSSKELTKEVN